MGIDKHINSRIAPYTNNLIVSSYTADCKLKMRHFANLFKSIPRTMNFVVYKNRVYNMDSICD